MDFSFLIGGEAGQGVQSTGYILAMCMAKGGYYVFANQDYESRIRGGHNYFQIRVRNNLVQAIQDNVNLIVALNEETIPLHKPELTQGGLIVYDGEKTSMNEEEQGYVNVPLEDIALQTTGNRIMRNTVALGATVSLVKYDLNILNSVLEKVFGRKSLTVVQKNVKAAKAGYDYITKNLRTRFDIQLPLISHSRRMLLNGNEAVALGAMAGGCKFVSGYPMTPSTGILQYFAAKSKDFNLIFEQAEDEIAALNMILGASYAGVRSMTTTSGGGFSLMVEALSLAGMTETPAVIVLGQRVGPATGFPTRTEQGELEFVIYAGHGMFPRVVFAPGTLEEAFYLTAKAFNIAEKYQVPVIILTDTYLADSYVTTEKYDLARITIDRGTFLSDDEIEALGKYKYMRHKLTESGVSPRVFPGQVNALVVTDSDEHTEDGHITESAEVRNKMVKKRLKKMESIETEIEAPKTFGQVTATTVLVGWGSTYGALKEAVERLNFLRYSVKMVHMSEVWPFPRKPFLETLKGSQNFVVVESNATGQMAHLIKAETGLEADHKILKYDGRPITPAYIIKRYQEVMK